MDASYKIQRGIHVHLIQFFMCPEFWVHIKVHSIYSVFSAPHAHLIGLFHIRMEVANKYGMIQPGQSNTQAVRAVFVIDPNGVVRTILYYPLSTGRNFDEIKRIILALQKADADACATPADWRPGDDVIVPTAGSCGVARERMENQSEDQYCLDWFLCFRKESN